MHLNYLLLLTAPPPRKTIINGIVWLVRWILSLSEISGWNPASCVFLFRGENVNKERSQFKGRQFTECVPMWPQMLTRFMQKKIMDASKNYVYYFATDFKNNKLVRWQDDRNVRIAVSFTLRTRSYTIKRI